MGNRIKYLPENSGKVLIFCTSLFFGASVMGQSGVKIYEEDWTIPGYQSPLPDPNPMFYNKESYQGASRVIYPYKLMDNIIAEKEEKTLKTVIVENEYIKVCITPEIGGKLYYATDKTNNYNFIYKNNTFKPANIGMFGAWVSGGIEWCVLHHHRASTFLPVDYSLQENPDGSKTIWIGETEPRQRIRWTIGVTVFPGKSYYQTEVKIHNRSALTHSFLYWANTATHVNDRYQVIFPPTQQFVVYHAKNSFAHWPVSHEVYNGVDYTAGVDLSWWKNHPEPISFFAYDLQEDFMGGYDFGKQSGTVHIGDHNIVKGAKLWEWGPGREGQIWDKALTDTDGPYAELMTGAFSDNQPDYSWIKPYEVKSFKQYWYPVKDIQGFKNANLNAAVNLEMRNGKAFLAYYTTSAVKRARVLLLNKNKIIFEKEMSLSPEMTFNQEIGIPAGTLEVDLKTLLINRDSGDTLITYQPTQKVYIEELPPVVEQPKPPAEIKTVEELYLTGSRIWQFHNATLDAMDYFREALKRDPDDIRTNTALGSVYLKRGNYSMAKSHLRTAIKRLTANYTRPESCEALYLLGLALTATGDYNSAIDTLYRASWDYAFHAASFTELARISCRHKDYAKALEQIHNALSTNGLNNSAICLQAHIARKMGRNTEALKLLDPLINTDPLDFFALYERYLASGSNALYLDDFRRKMRKFDQNYLELATDYMHIGQWAEINDLLTLYLEEAKGGWVNPMAYYYLGYLADQTGDRSRASEYYKEASALPVDFCFPYRFEEVNILETALKYFPDDAKPNYYLGNLLYDHQPDAAIKKWERAVILDPMLSIAYRNLGWGYYHAEKNVQKAIDAYEKALAYKKDDPMYYAELYPLYEINNTDMQTRLNLFRDRHEVVKGRVNSLYSECKLLNLTGAYQKTIDGLAESNFQIREGTNQLREVNVDAHLLYGRQLLAEKRNTEALEVFLNAQFLPGRHMERTEYVDQRKPQIDYFIGLAYKALGDSKNSRAYFARATEYSLPATSYLNYYQGLAWMNLGQQEKADALFDGLVKSGEEILSKGEDVDFFEKFGGRETENMILSRAYLLKGLGLKGKNNIAASDVNLNKALACFNSNLWAKAELSGMNQ